MTQHLMVCFSGWAGTGKDECSNHLVNKYGAIHTGLADPGKRHMLDTYGFTIEQLWGPSKFRNEGDPRYPKPHTIKLGFSDLKDGTWGLEVDVSNRSNILSLAREIDDDAKIEIISELQTNYRPNFKIIINNKDPKWFLSPRESLQKYMELMNTLYADTWIRKGIEIHKQIASGIQSKKQNEVILRFSYEKTTGVVDNGADQNLNTLFGDLFSNIQYTNKQKKLKILNNVFITCFSDFRHIHEHRLARESEEENFKPVLVRIKRPNVKYPPFQHRSETEQTRIRDSSYDFIIENDGTIEDLHKKIDEIIKICSNPKWSGKKWSPEYVLSTEQESYQK